MLHLLEGLFKYTLLRIEGEKSPAPGCENQTHNLSVMRRGLYRCDTTTAQLLEFTTAALVAN